MKFWILILLLSSLTACAPKKSEEEEALSKMTPEQKAEKQYTEFVENTYIDLSQMGETILELAVKKEGMGFSLQDIQNREDEAEILVQKRLIIWDSNAGLYNITSFGKEVYQKGQELKEKDPYNVIVKIK